MENVLAQLSAALAPRGAPDDRAAAAQPNGHAQPPVDLGSSALLQQLDRLLSEDDAQASQLMEARAGEFKQLLGQAYPGINEAVSEFDFEAALGLLHQARDGAVRG